MKTRTSHAIRCHRAPVDLPVFQSRRRPASNQRVVPYLVMRSNLDVVLERLSADHTGEVEHLRRA